MPPIVELTDGRLMASGRYDRPEDQARFLGKTPFSYSADALRVQPGLAQGTAAGAKVVAARRMVNVLRRRNGPSSSPT
jgi:hypothetical protein